MKSYTDIEQSRKLAEILPIESANMCWVTDEIEPLWGVVKSEPNDDFDVIHCWSLAALLEVIGVECRMEKTPLDQSGEFTYSFVDDYYNIRTFEEDNAVDTAIEMIYKLKEKDLL